MKFWTTDELDVMIIPSHPTIDMVQGYERRAAMRLEDSVRYEHARVVEMGMLHGIPAPMGMPVPPFASAVRAISDYTIAKQRFIENSRSGS